ncbi:energy transducer TonB [Christiangramia sp. SM2212]|uniref:Energy transducer TonB n=1 Tax=Christiangramia sediminicola TaxID=3073267 RepID=A0ABU1EM64_9FLAO|nr:energy transducer TonB [Christiangramia sp. SM2212]MDR5589473.1 energy transducer TonB [Christiangramia sp. SM2212]
MREFSVFLLLILSITIARSQESNNLISWEDVQSPPIFSGCENADSSDNCSKKSLINFIKNNFDYEAIPDSIASPAINFKLIIGTNGKLRWSSVQTENPVVKKEAERILQSLPQLKPGYQDGDPMNVMTNIQILLNRVTDIMEFNLVDTPPIPLNCKKASNKTKCFTESVSRYVNSHFDTRLVLNLRGSQNIFRTNISFVIDESGEIKNIKATGDNEIMNNEAIRVVKEINKMEPAIYNGKPVKVSFQLPIVIGRSSR